MVLMAGENSSSLLNLEKLQQIRARAATIIASPDEVWSFEIFLMFDQDRTH